MENKKRSSPAFSQKEIELIEQLRRNPKMMGRVQHILAMTNASEGPLKTADQIEDLLVAELRLLGNDTMTEWLSRADKQVGQELKAKDKKALKRKKKH
jgi:septum formation inhibitor MinC